MTPGEVAARVPFTVADALAVGGAASVAGGLWLTFGLGPTLMACGVAAIWVAGLLYRPRGNG